MTLLSILVFVIILTSIGLVRSDYLDILVNTRVCQLILTLNLGNFLTLILV